MMKIAKNKKIYLSILAALLFFATGLNAAWAANPLELIMADPLFDVSNAAPGQSFSSDVTLLNHGDNHEDFQFEVDIKTNPHALADRLFFKVTDGAGNCLYGCGGNITLSYLDRREPNVARVDPHSTTYYKFIITFDPTAGNEFQATLVTFDMKLGFEGTTTATNGGGNGGTAAGGGGVTGGLVAGFAARAPTGGTGIVAGEETPGETLPGEVKGESTPEGQVEGAETSVCQGWPKWVWVLMLLAYFAAFLWRTFENIKTQIEKRDIRWKWQAALAVAAFLFWQIFDFCREFRWFVILAIIGGAMAYLAYLYLFKKNIQRKNEEIDDGFDQAPPIT